MKAQQVLVGILVMIELSPSNDFRTGIATPRSVSYPHPF